MVKKTFTLACSDIGNESCSHVVEGDTPAKTKRRMMIHAEKTHDDLLEAMSEDEIAETQAKMDEVLNR